MRKSFVCGVAIFLAAVIWLPGSFRKEDIKVHKLDNGLKVLLLEDHGIPNCALYVYYRVGSRNERPGLTGVSHFIEHMMFNGSTKVAPGEFDRRMEFAGGSNNASTGTDRTGYTDWFPAAALEAMLEMEADRMQGASFDPEVLESERQVVASERRMAVDNSNESILDENVQATAIMAHPYHWGVIGWMSDILGWRRSEILDYYRTYYSPNNAVLILVGDFAEAKALELIKKHFGPIPAGTPPPKVITVEPPQMGTKRVVIKKEAQVPSLQIAWHAPGVRDPEHIPMSVLSDILLRGRSSRLYRRLVREEQLATAVYGGQPDTIDPFLFSVSVQPKPDADPARIEAVIEEELAKVKKDGVTADEIQKVMNAARSDFYMGLQTISGKASRLAETEMTYGSFEKLFTMMDDFAAVKNEQIIAAAKKYFTDNSKTVGTLLPPGGDK
ncbi:MAG: insulinase family protein [Candidatus Aminicenantes bacterium]|nr:insulinase family protein [Candidatus Aminicenantes bacterium]